jgi:hypothetical protein
MFRSPFVQLCLVATFAATAVATAHVSIAQEEPGHPGRPSSGRQIPIQPMTQVDTTTGAGYFSDPYPIHIEPSRVNGYIPPSFSGTTKEILSCPGGIRPGCFVVTPITVIVGSSIQREAQSQGSTITAIENNNIFRDNFGQWQMATTLYVKNPAYPDAGPWNVIVHAHPFTVTSFPLPNEWVADTLLIGSFAQPARANYDGKYFEGEGDLYLVYSKRLSDQPARDGIVAQLMQSATEPAPAAPTVLLQPEEAEGGYNSEYSESANSNSQFKLIETGNVTVVDGKYALAYSTGAYDQPNYKAGVAWSDTFLPADGSSYKKMLREDAAGVWGQPNHLEVQYLLQSQESDWPNYVASEVLAPGVPSIVEDEDGSWFLYLAGYDPSDAPTVPGTADFNPSHRSPFFLRLQIEVPAGATVATTSNLDLTSWITSARR